MVSSDSAQIEATGEKYQKTTVACGRHNGEHSRLCEGAGNFQWMCSSVLDRGDDTGA